MSEYLVKHLVDFGLSENEAKIYLALLELGSATVAEVSKQSTINRSTAYVVLDSLRKKDLVQNTDDNVRKYLASSPEILLYYATESLKRHEYIKSGIETILPKLKAIKK